MIHPIIRPLLTWYNLNKRDLPWRKTSNPYHIWLSEIILQQTRVDQGMEYYIKFVSLFPDIESLAAAPEDLVMRTWQGLGYYSRARNLHFAAKQVVQQFNGNFPDNYNEILLLKGVGTYTAAAVASFAYNEPKAVVDGNVYRFLSRYFGVKTPIDSTIGKKEFQILADEVLDKKNPGTFNQAIMEFGAMVCKPQIPFCETCIFNESCFAFNNKLVKELPIKEKKVKVGIRNLHYLLVFDSNANFLIHKRGKNDIWESLYEFVLIEDDFNSASGKMNLESFDFLIKNEFEPTKHILTHQHIYATFTIGLVNEFSNKIQTSFEKESWLNANNKAFPRLISRFLEKNEVQKFIDALIKNEI